MIGSVLCALVALAFGALGIGSYATPAEVGFVRALGTRDFVLGLLVAQFLRAPGSRGALRTVVGFSAIVAAGDFAAVATASGFARKMSLALHAGGMVGLLVIWRLLAAEP